MYKEEGETTTAWSHDPACCFVFYLLPVYSEQDEGEMTVTTVPPATQSLMYCQKQIQLVAILKHLSFTDGFNRTSLFRFKY